MELKVTKRYVDRYTKKIVEKDTVINNVSDERAKELLEQKVVEENKEAKDLKKTTVIKSQ